MSAEKTVFVTGGAGYIGSHCVVELLTAGYRVVAVDNFTNSVNGVDGGSAPSLQRAEQITGKSILFYRCDLLDRSRLENIFSQVMKLYNVYSIVFSSSCCVYGDPEYLPITEAHPIGNVASVYGRTKYLIEEMLSDLCVAEKNWNVISLRYFNPVGAHPSGAIGEDPTKAFTNLMPYMAQVAIGKKPELTIFGGDYDTVDGTGVRDYIHVMDLATGHVAALRKLEECSLRYKIYNLGTGNGVSVIQLVKAFEKASKCKIPYRILPRRAGDIAAMYADSSLAAKELGWTAAHDLDKMCEDFWRWQTLNPNGYRNDPSSATDVPKTIVAVNNGEMLSTSVNNLHVNGH